MSDSLRIVRVFIGSPGGLDEERQAAHEIVDSVNRSHSERWGVLFRLLGWENAVPGYIRPQSKINEDLDRCDYFIGVLWNKWGTRPSTDPDGFTSGFEEEYFRAKARIDNGVMRDMAIYFKVVEVPTGLEPGEEVRKVLDFRQNCIDEKKVFFKNFTDLHSFRDVIREKLEEIGWRETEILSERHQLTQSEKTPSSQDAQNATPSPTAWLIDEEAREFLNDLTCRSPEWDGTSPHEVARLRLIGTAVARSGNDAFYLGTHDANLIFQNFRNAPLSEQEVRALIDCGVVGFQYHNVPLWRWVARHENSVTHEWARIKILAAWGTENEKKHAIDILGLLSQRIPSMTELFDEKRVLSQWLSDDTPNAVFDAAVSFLSANAHDGDLQAIEEIAAKCSPHRRTKIEGAIVGILSRNSLDGAIKRLIENDVDKIEEEIAEAIFKSPQSIATEAVLSCLSVKSETIRVRAAQVLSSRNEITLKAAQTLLTDSNYEIRLIAAESLNKLGVVLDDAIAKKALRIVRPSSFGLAGLLSQHDTDESYYQRYISNRLKELDLATLKAKAAAADALDQQEISVLYSKYPSKMLAEMRSNLSDRFKAFFEIKIRQDIEGGRTDAEIESRQLRIETIRKQLCSSALTALCGVAKSEDLRLVRRVIDEIEVDASEKILSYLSRFGDWSDIERIKKLGDHRKTRWNLLEMVSTKLPKEKAAAIYALGQDRIADMLALDLDSSVRISLAKLLPKRVFVALRDEALLGELGNENDAYRSVFALRCVQTLPKKRLTALLDRYVDHSDTRFYNSVHWLDLGVSLSSELAKSVAERALSRY